MKVIKIGERVTDIGPKEVVTVNFMRIERTGHQPLYLVQPYGVDQKSGGPLKHRVVLQDQLKAADAQMETMDYMPTAIIGSTATDTRTGRKGTIRAVVFHVSRCWHGEFQPHTRSERGNLADPEDINLDYLDNKLIAEWKKDRDAREKAAVLAAIEAERKSKKPVPAPAPRSPIGIEPGCWNR